MKKLIILLLAALSGAVLLQGQERYPFAVAGPDGIYVNCGDEIPRDFAYQIFRRASGSRNWEEQALISAETQFDRFFRKVWEACAHNPIYDFPKESEKLLVWKILHGHEKASEIPLYGTLPMYQEALGVTWYDEGAEKGRQYEYRVVTLKNGLPPVEKTTRAVRFPPAEKKDYKIWTTGQDAREEYVRLDYTITDRQDMYTSKLLRSYYLQSDFTPVSAHIGYDVDTHGQRKAFAVDTTALYRGIILYCLQPYDIYGNPGQPSDTVRITNLINKSESVLDGLSADPAENGIRISWQLVKPEFLRSIDLYKGIGYRDTIDYKYLLSMSPKDTVYLDTDVEPAQIYSYKLVINNAYGQSPQSMRVVGWYYGNRPAETPLELEAEVAMDVVTLRWRRPSEDTQAYYVLRGEGDASNLQQIGDAFVSDSLIVSFTDSVKNVPGRTLAYAVRAENTSRNFSPPTDPVFVNPLRDIPLSVPINVATRYADGRVWVTWDQVDETDANVIDYRVERRILAPEAEAEFKPVPTSKILLNYYEDADVKEGITYEYRVVSLGSHSQVSEPSIPSGCLVPAVLPISISSLQVHQTQDGYRLAWEKTGQEDIANYKVYRVQAGQSPKLLATLKTDETTWFDPMKPDGVVYLYAVTCLGTNGIESEIVRWMGAN
jgi:fibronectin type 3 domain-containing protein